MPELNAQQFDYRGDPRRAHMAPGPEDAPFHDLEDMMPDVYDRPDLYEHGRGTPEGRRMTRETMSQALRARGNPEADVTVYRALPAPHRSINQGDWVSTSLTYTRGHAAQSDNPAEDWPIVRATVKAKHLNNEGYLHEYGYNGPSIKEAPYA